MARETEIKMSPEPSEGLFKTGILYEVNTPERGATDIASEGDREGYLRRIAETNKPSISEVLYFGNSVVKSTLVNDGEVEDVKLDADGIERVYTGYREGELRNAELISIVKPIAPYSEGGLMMVQGPLSSCFDEEISSHMLFDASKETQEEYWRQATAILRKSLEVSQNTPEDLEGFRGVAPMLVEHHSARITSEEHPGLRTLGLHHGHLIFYNAEHAVREDWDKSIFRIPTQERLMQRSREPNLTQFIDGVNEKVTRPEFHERTASPVGYQANIRYNDPKQLAEFMTEHYRAYKEAAEEMEEKLRQRLGRKSEKFFEGNIVQPTYGMVLLPSDEENATLLVTPAIVPIGPIEHMGIRLKRDPEFTRYNDKVQTDKFQRLILKDLVLSN